MDALQNPVPPTKPKSTYPQHVPAVDQAIRLLYALARCPDGSASLTELCRMVGINKSKGLSILNTLQTGGFVTRDPQSKIYRLGPGLLVLSRSVLDHNDLATQAAPFLQRLATATGSTTLLGSISGEEVYIVARGAPTSELNMGIVVVQVGHRFPLYYGSIGKAILGVLPPDERERLLAEGDLRFGEEPAHLDRDSLRAEILQAARLGYAEDLGVMNDGISALCAPLLDHHQRPAACLLVVGTFPASKVAAHGQRLVDTAREMSLRLPFLQVPSAR